MVEHRDTRGSLAKRIWQKVTLFVDASAVSFVLTVLTMARSEICSLTYCFHQFVEFEK